MYKKQINKLRDRNNISKQTVADYLKIDRTSYSHYEQEDDIMPIKHLIKVCEYFNISIDHAFSITNEPNYPNNQPNANITLSAKRIKELRTELNLTLYELGDILKCSYGTIAGYERARYLISTPLLYDICKKYKVSADYLLGKINSPKYYNKSKDN